MLAAIRHRAIDGQGSRVHDRAGLAFAAFATTPEAAKEAYVGHVDRLLGG